ncbi:MAG: hypothetical protein OHK0023_14190 [Anaerolineae bacterium]
MELLQPVNDTVNYAVGVQAVDPWTLDLVVEKYWKEPNGYLGVDSLTVNSYDAEDGREQGEQERAQLMEVFEGRGLEAMMHKAELTAMQNDWLDGDRADPCLFRQGPPDRFETLAQQLEGEINPYWNTDGEKIENPAPQPEVENPYWRLDPIPVNDPGRGTIRTCSPYGCLSQRGTRPGGSRQSGDGGRRAFQNAGDGALRVL